MRKTQGFQEKTQVIWQKTQGIWRKTQGIWPKTRDSANSELVNVPEFCPKVKPTIGIAKTPLQIIAIANDFYYLLGVC